MNDVFNVLQFSGPNSSTPLPDIMTLLEQWDIIDIPILKNIYHSCILYLYRQEYELQILTWILDLIEIYYE